MPLHLLLLSAHHSSFLLSLVDWSMFERPRRHAVPFFFFSFWQVLGHPDLLKMRFLIVVLLHLSTILFSIQPLIPLLLRLLLAGNENNFSPSHMSQLLLNIVIKCTELRCFKGILTCFLIFCILHVLLISYIFFYCWMGCAF